MNDQSIDLKGKTVVIRNPLSGKKYSTRERTFVITGGSGCHPEMCYNRKLKGHWLDGSKDTVDSYDIEKVLEK